MKVYNDDVMEAVRCNLGLQKDDTSQDAAIMTMDKREVFERYCRWNGLIGCWDEYLLDAVSSIWNVKLK